MNPSAGREEVGVGRTELAAIRQQLEALASGQANLTRVVAQYHQDVVSTMSGALPRTKAHEAVRQREPKPGAHAAAAAAEVSCMDGHGEAGPTEGTSSGSQALTWLTTPRPSYKRLDSESPRIPPSKQREGGKGPARVAQEIDLDHVKLALSVADSDATHVDATKSAVGRRVGRIKELLELHEQDEEDGMEGMSSWLLGSQTVDVYRQTSLERLRVRVRKCFSDRKKSEQALDTAFAGVIFANSIYIGLEMDAERDSASTLDGWSYAAITFSGLFWLELFLRLLLNGFHRQFCGKGRLLNIFDATVIVTDTFQSVCRFMDVSVDLGHMPSVSILRLLRLVRLARLVRLLQSHIYKDLLTMIHSLVAGMITLGWALVLVALMIYATSLVCRELLGRGDVNVENVSEHFSSVPRSFLTISRCTFGDCSSDSGVPIIEHVASSYGYVWGACYFIFMAFWSIGCFNVITAIFLDRTLATAAENDLKKQEERLADKHLWAASVSILIRKILDVAPKKSNDVPEHAKLSECMEEILEVEVPRKVLKKLLKTPGMAEVLDGLDVDPNDRESLGDIIDADHSGTIGILEFVNGLQRLRGNKPRRSDVVSVDLMVRDLQEKVGELLRKSR